MVIIQLERGTELKSLCIADAAPKDVTFAYQPNTTLAKETNPLELTKDRKSLRRVTTTTNLY